MTRSSAGSGSRPPVPAAPCGQIRLLRIGIEGTEPTCLGPFLAEVPLAPRPDLVLFEHAHAGTCGVAPDALPPAGAYRIRRRFRHDTLVERPGPRA